MLACPAGASQAPLPGAKNVVLILADQLRADCLGCYGNRLVRTPHIDRLAREGTRCAQAFAQHPQCVPSRSAMLTGRYPHANGAISNYTAMSPAERTLPEYLRARQYRTMAVGKLHLFEDKQKAGFTDTMLSEGQHSGATDPEVLHPDYKKWIREHGHWEALKKSYAAHGDPEYRRNFQARVNDMPVEAYIDSWAGDRAVDYIRSQPQGRPFFLFAGFPNPHNPFEPPEPYASMYEPEQMPIPECFHSDLSAKPPQHLAYKRSGRPGYAYENLDAEKLRRVIAYYYGSISLVDAQVGKILAVLEERRLLDDTLIILTSDHGEFLGHHGMLLKSIDEYPMLYDVLIHVPLIFRGPSVSRGGVIEDLVELIDICPTVLDWAGLSVAPEIQGASLMTALRGGNAPPRDFVFSESGAVKTLRGKRHKVVYYPGQTYGELYDLVVDPQEAHNLYHLAEFREIRQNMVQLLLDRLISTEAPRHGQSLRGPAYWRSQYRAPFAPQKQG
jgi:arylsulfatase A-like enzyme